MPRSGSGAIAGFGRRLVAAVIDWNICQIIAFGIFRIPFGQAGPHSFVPLAIFVVENLLLVGTLGFTIGHRLLGLQVRSLRRAPLNLLQVLVRSVLLALFIPAVFWDRDGRGLHDKAAATVIVRL